MTGFILGLVGFISVLIIAIGVYVIVVYQKALLYAEALDECVEDLKLQIGDKFRLSKDFFEKARVLVSSEESVFDEIAAIEKKLGATEDIYESMDCFKTLRQKEEDIVLLEKFYQAMRNNIPYKVARDKSAALDVKVKEYADVYNMAADIFNDYYKLSRNKIVCKIFGYREVKLIDNIDVKIEVEED